jgi:hypothetical protein
MILQGPDHLKSRAVTHVGEARIFVAAEISLKDTTVVCAIEHGTPGFKLAHAIRGLLRMQLGHSPVVEILPSAHGVGKMDLPAVAIIHICESGRYASFSHHSMSLSQQRSTDHSD